MARRIMARGILVVAGTEETAQGIMRTLSTASNEPDTESLIDQQQRRLEHALRYIDQQQAELDAQRLRLRAQRRRVSAVLKQRRAELLEQIEQFHAALTAHATVGPAGALPLTATAEASATATNQGSAANDKTYELQRRFEMAVEDMRAYKHRVEELEEQLAKRPPGAEKHAGGGPLNWADQKAIMLASLETDMAGADQQSIDNRLTVEGAVRITDEVLAGKEREIQQLKRQLEDLRAERIVAAAHDSDVAEVLDRDAVIAAERERLRKLQESVLEKQRTAEVELALERAKLARQRTEIENRLHSAENDLARHQEASAGSATTAAQSKSGRGRWLARLGLKDGEGS